MAPNAREVFARNLRRYMKLNGIEQVTIAERLDVAASTVSDWVNGNKYPRVDAMQQLADMFGVVVSDLNAHSEVAHVDELIAGFDELDVKTFGVTRDFSPEDKAAVYEYALLMRKARHTTD